MMSNVAINVDDRYGADRCIRKFKRLCDACGVVKEYRKRQEYKKPSVRLKEKRESAEKRRIKNIVKLRRYSTKL